MGQQYVNAYEYRYKVRRAEAAFTCSEDETVAKGFSLYCPGPTSASSLTSLTAMLGLHTPWSHSLSCWLPLLVDAGAGSCRWCVGGTITGMQDAGLLLLVETGQSMLCFQEEPKLSPSKYIHSGCFHYGVHPRAPLRRAAPS